MTLVGSVCTGIGGLDLAVDAVWPAARWAWMADPDPHAARVLATHYPKARPALRALRAHIPTATHPEVPAA